MSGLTKFKHWALLPVGLLVASVGFVLFAHPAMAAPTSTTGEITGGPYTFNVGGTELQISSDTTTVSLEPSGGNVQTAISGGKLTIGNVSPGTYTVTLNFKATKDLCNQSTLAQIILNLPPAAPLKLLCNSGTGDTYYSASKSFPGVVVTAGNTTDLGSSGSLGNTTHVSADGTPIIDCKSKGILMTLVVCPSIGVVLGVMSWIIDNFIQPYLSINPLTVTDSTGAQTQLYIIWNNVRSFANIVLILAFFVIIFSQATSIGISNYGIKRLLPRLILVAIATNISFFICAFLVDASNVLGAGAASLLVSTVLNGTPTITVGSDLFNIGGTVGQLSSLPAQAGMTAGILFGLFIFILVGSAVLFIAAVVILLRQLLIAGGTMASPLIFLAGLLPNTQPTFRWGIKSFIKLLAMYPIMMFAIASGTVLTGVLDKIGPVGNGAGPAAVSSVIKLLVLIVELMLIIFSIKFAGGGLHKVQAALSNTGKSLGKGATKIGKKTAMNSKYGQAAQQFMGNRKNISQLKGREALSGILSKNPTLMKLMGGPGGGKYAARVLETEQRKQRAEKISELKAGLTPNVASAIAGKENIAQALQSGKWASGRDVTPEDASSFEKLKNQGYLGATGNVIRRDPALTTAAMHSIMETEIATSENMQGLARQLSGAPQEEVARYSEDLRAAASAHGYKNFSTATVDAQGNLIQYYGKSGTANVAEDRIKGAESVIQSGGLRNINKDAVDATADTSLLEGINRLYQKAATPEAKREFVARVADQTSHIEKVSVVENIVQQFGGSISRADFQALQRNIKSGGAAAVGSYVKTGDTGTPPPAPPAPPPSPPPTVTGPGGGTFTPSGPGGLFIPH